MIFAASFCGKFLNFYYDSRFWDSGMHLLSGGLCVLLGYEVVVAMQKRDGKPVSIPVALLCALCFSFFVSTCWELVEFTMDQVMTNPEKGTIGDAQHWCYELAKGTSKESTIFDPKNIERWPIMVSTGSDGNMRGMKKMNVTPMNMVSAQVSRRSPKYFQNFK